MNIAVIIVILIVIGGIIGAVMALRGSSSSGGGGDDGGGGGDDGGGGGDLNTFNELEANEPTETKDVSIGTNTITLSYTHSKLKNGIAEKCKDILANILTGGTNLTFTIRVGTFTNSVAGSFNPGNNEIRIRDSTAKIGIWDDNTLGETTDKVENGVDNDVSSMTSVLLHEIFHGLGFRNKDDFRGINVKAAHQAFTNASFTDETDYQGFPLIENDGGSGSANSHFDEGNGFGSDSVNVGDQPEVEFVYVYPRDIMTPINTGNGDISFITPMTLGVLQDNGFGVNYTSRYVYNPINGGVYGKTTPNTVDNRFTFNKVNI